MSTSDNQAAELALIRADRAHVRAYRETKRYREDAAYRQNLEQFDAVLAHRERELAAAEREEAR